MSSTKFVFFGLIGKTRWLPGLWLAETFSTSLKLLYRIWRNLTRSKISTSSTKFCVFQANWKNKMAAPATDCPRHFWLLLWNSWREFKESWQKARTQCTLPSLCFSGDWKNKMAAPASYWLREFQFLLWNCRTEFDEICKEARPQRPLPSLCFWANWKFKMVAPAYDWLRHLRLLLRNRWMELKETWLEAISQCSLPTFCLLGPSEKPRWPPQSLIGWSIFDFSSEIAERHSMKLDLNVLYQVQIVFGGTENQDGHPGQSINKGGTLYSGARYVALWASCFQHMIVHSHFLFA